MQSNFNTFDLDRLCFVGCFIPLPYGYPPWSQTCCEFDRGNDARWSEIARWPFDVIPGQSKIDVAYGFHWNCIALVFHKHVHKKVVVRLYRPGFETVQLTFWNGANAIQWKPAVSIEDQENAVDDLLEFDPGRLVVEEAKNWKFSRIPAGSRSPEHRKALLFAASEFERLSRTQCSAATRERLTEKSHWLREHAEN